MSNIFEQELQKLFGDGKIIENPAYSGRTCFGTLGKDLRVRAQFVSTQVSSEYDALKLTILNRTDGLVDSLTLKMEDLLGMKPVPNNPNFRDGVIPRLWDAYGEVKWYAYRPNTKDYKIIREAAERYLSVFRDHQQEREQSGPRLVYICAPLDENVSENIEFARLKAQEVFQFGDIPICPHLMFPPIIGLEHPELEKKMRKMGLRIIETCQQVNVYGTVLSKGMQTEINRAVLLNIPVKSDAKTVSYKPQNLRKRKKKMPMNDKWEIIQGDALKLLSGFSPGTFDAVITDPPYASGGRTQTEKNKSTDKKYSSMKSHAPPSFEGDAKDQRSWTRWAAAWLSDARKLCKPGAPVCMFIDWRQLPAASDALQWAGWIWRGTAVWDKGNSRPQKGRFRQQAEYIVWGSNGDMPVNRPVPCLPGVFKYGNPQKRIHLTEKPLQLMRDIVKITEPGGHILDPFAGSGTTILAAVLEGYTATGIELSEEYAMLSRERIERELKQTA